MPTANKDIELVVQITTYKENAKPRWWVHPNNLKSHVFTKTCGTTTQFFLWVMELLIQ